MVVVSVGRSGRYTRSVRTAVFAVLVSIGLLGATAPPAGAAPATMVQVIVRLQPGADVDAEARGETDQGGRVRFLYRAALRGFAVEVPEKRVEALRRNPRVVAVEPDNPVRVTQTQPAPVWGLDRSDQRALPLSDGYTYPRDGAGVTAYVIDTGILAGHTDFGGRARSGYTAINDGRGTSDCNGHGTHVAGTISGSTYGVAKGASPVAVRVLDCSGSGATSGVIAGLDWATANHAAGTPAVANLSLGGPVSSTMDAAVQSLIDDGVTVVVAAGNNNTDACTQSPARVPAALTVAASTRSDARASFSNLGTCTDLFAPGEGVLSDWYTSTTATNTLSGTSMASPHVAGAAAILLSRQTGLAPAEVASGLLGASTPGVVTNAGADTPNRLLYVDNPAVLPLTVTNPGDQAGTVGTAVTVPMKAADGSPPYSFGATGLPAGLSIAASTGVISGTPAVAGSAPVTVTVTDSAGLSAATTFTWTVGAGCAGNGQKVVNPGFESGTTGWTATAGVIGQPGTVQPARTGTWNARLGGKGVLNTTTLAQSVTIPAGCSTYTLSYWLRIDTAEATTVTKYDKLTVTLGTTTLAGYSNLDRSAGYVERRFAVAGKAGKTVTLKFTATEDRSLQTTFAVDDTGLGVN